MRIVFAGTAPFAVPSLEVCAERHEVAAVVTQPDRPGHRGRPAPRPVADAAVAHGLAVLQPVRIRAPEVVEAVLALHADALVVAAYGQIIPVALLDGHRYGGVNVHASLLPRWRGAAPVNAAILAGDERAGVCVMRMEAGLDTGPVYACDEFPLGAQDDAPAVLERMAGRGAALLADVLAALEDGRAVATPQDDSLATQAPRMTREDGMVDWTRHGAAQIDRMVRALQPWPGVTAVLGGQPVRILAGAPAGPVTGGAPGDATARESGVEVTTCDGVFRIDRVQPPGGRPMDAAAYLRGRR